MTESSNRFTYSILAMSLVVGLVVVMFGTFSPQKEMVFTFNKEDCTYSVNGFSTETGIAKKIVGKWVQSERTLQSKSCSLITNSTGKFLTITKVYKEGIYEANINLLDDPEWVKSSMLFTNHGEKNEFAFTDKIMELTK